MKLNRKKCLAAGVLATAFCFSINTYAFYVADLDKAPEKPSFDLQGVGSVVTQIGATKQVHSPYSFGLSIPVDTAMMMILPNDWQFALSDVDTKKLVSWERSNDWLANLEKIGEQSGLRFLVSWKESKIYVTNAGEKTTLGALQVAKATKIIKPVPPIPPAPSADTLKSVELLANQLVLNFNGKPIKVTHFTIPSPPRLVVDVFGVQLEKGAKTEYALSKNIDGMEKMRIGKHEDHLRFVFDAGSASKTIPDTAITYPLIDKLQISFSSAAYQLAEAGQKEIKTGQKKLVYKKPIVLQQGMLKQELEEFAKYHGYSLAWELDQNKAYYIQFKIEIDSEWPMEQQMKKIQSAVNQNGNRIKLVAWRDNKVLQVRYY